MKKLFRYESFYDHIVKKTLRIMRITLFLLLVGILQVFAVDSYSQIKTISLKMEQTRIVEVLNKIEDQSQFRFIYSPNTFDINDKVTVNVNEQNIEKVLDQIFNESSVTYKIFDTQIVLSSVDSVQLQEEKTVTGNVSDKSNLPLPGVTVIIKGTTIGTITDSNGKFSLDNVPNNATLVFSFIGMKTHEIFIADKDEINIALEEETIGLEEVVAIGYGTQKKGNLTAAISSIDSEELTTTTNSSLAQALAGKIPGLNIRQNNGEPGTFDTDINIRGFGEPIFIIDGVKRQGSTYFQQLNANDIESMSVLKDASAAIYGMNAANGVIIVTTKKGMKEKPKFNYSGTMGWQTPTNVPEMMNAYEFLSAYNEATIYGKGYAYITAEELGKWKNEEPGYESTDWYGATFKNSSPQTKHDISVRGGNELINYYTNIGYFHEGGLYKTNDLNYEQYSFRTNIEAKLSNNLTADISVYGRYDTRKTPGETFFFNYYATRLGLPNQPVYANNNMDYPGVIFPLNQNPVVLSDADLSGYHKTRNKSFNGQAQLTYKAPFLPGLEVKGTIAYDSYTTNSTRLLRANSVYSYNADTDTYTETIQRSTDEINRSTTDQDNLVMQATINYAQTFNKMHNVSGMIGFERNQIYYEDIWAYRDFELYTFPMLNYGSTTNMKNSGGYSKSASMGYVGRLNYNFKGKYLIDFSCRYDGSYRYDPKYRWAFFPQVSAGWRISEETFVKNNFPSITNLKLRGSWGKIGSDQGNAFQYLEGYSIGGNNYYVFTDGIITQAVISPAVTNKNLTWVKNELIDFGFDLDLKNGLFNLTADLYRRNQDGLLAYRLVSLPNTFGGALPQENLNGQRTQGFDFSVSHTNRIGDFNYSAKFTFDFPRTQYLYQEEREFGNSMDKWKNSIAYRNADFDWGYELSGQFTNQEEINQAPVYGEAGIGNTKHLPGDYSYSDLNGDGVINSSDMSPTFWNSNPKVFYGVVLAVEWKGLDLNMVLQGAAKYTVTMQGMYAQYFSYSGANNLEMWTDRWHLADPYNAGSEWIPGGWPAMRLNEDMAGSNYYSSEIWKRDASYLRMKSVELGYTIPRRWSQKISLESTRIYLNAHNLFTICDELVKPFDPEKAAGTENLNLDYPIMKSFNVGVNIQF